MSRKNANEARRVADELGLSNHRLAVVLGCRDGQVFKYLGGHRRLSPGQASALVSEYGEDAHRLIEACAYAWMIINPERPAKLATDGEVTFDYWADIAAQDDGERISIEEWKKRYGQPGSGADVNGRMGGVFASEPCFLGE